MFNLCLRALILLWILAFLVNSLEAQTNENEQSSESSQEILVFRTSPAKESSAEGWFRFQVSAFSPLLVVKVNGFAQMVKEGADWAEYEIPYFLKKGKNLFKIFVLTKTGQHEQEFFVTYEPVEKYKKAPPPLNGVIMIGQTNSDNILSVQEGNSKTSAAKNDLLLSGAYAIEINKEIAVYLSAVLKFDRHQNRSLVGQEVLFRQLGSEYRDKNLLGFEFSTVMGQSVISLKEANPSNPYSAGEFREDIRSLYISAGAKKSWGKKFSVSLKIQLDNQNKVKTDSEDGTLTKTSLGVKSRLGNFNIKGLLDSNSTSFKAPRKDYQSSLLDAGIAYSWTPWVFGVNYQNTNQQYKNVDPATNIALKNKKDVMSLNFKYAFSKSTIWGLDLKQIKQDSNDATKVFTENQTIFQYIWMF